MNKFANLVVHLNEDNIEEVKELLLSNGEKLCSINFDIVDDTWYNYLQINPENEWEMWIKHIADKEITLEEFKRLINEK